MIEQIPIIETITQGSKRRKRRGKRGKRERKKQGEKGDDKRDMEISEKRYQSKRRDIRDQNNRDIDI